MGCKKEREASVVTAAQKGIGQRLNDFIDRYHLITVHVERWAGFGRETIISESDVDPGD